jgi:predicted nucleic acid-binding protein
MAYLFDTDAISEALRSRPNAGYLEWLLTIPRNEQYTSAVVVGELFKGAFRSPARDRHLSNIDERVLPAVTVLPFDVAVARVFGRIRAGFEESGKPVPDADIQIAATALYHNLELVTGNLKHFKRIPELSVNPVFAEARRKHQR